MDEGFLIWNWTESYRKNVTPTPAATSCHSNGRSDRNVTNGDGIPELIERAEGRGSSTAELHLKLIRVSTEPRDFLFVSMRVKGAGVCAVLRKFTRETDDG